MGKNVKKLVEFFCPWEKKNSQSNAQKTCVANMQSEEKRRGEKRRATRREEDDKQRSFHPKSHSRELPMRKGKWKERQL